MELLLVPLIGPFHLRSPAYNAITVRDLLSSWETELLATSALSPGQLEDPSWQDTEEIALPLAVAPWARARGLPLKAVGEPAPLADAEADFRRYLEPYPQMRSELTRIDRLEAPVAELLQSPLNLDTITTQLVPALRKHQEAREAAFEDGPASGWLRRRSETAAARVMELGAEKTALLAPAEHVPFLGHALERLGARLATLPQPVPTPQSRERALLDFAFRAEAPEPGKLIEQLHELPSAEARFHEANLLVANGHGFEALELLERTSRGDFSQPYFLPGYLLARLGQLRDLDSRREDALRAYRGVLALDYAPSEAKEAARAGLERPFSP